MSVWPNPTTKVQNIRFLEYVERVNKNCRSIRIEENLSICTDEFNMLFKISARTNLTIGSNKPLEKPVHNTSVSWVNYYENYGRVKRVMYQKPPRAMNADHRKTKFFDQPKVENSH